MFKKILVPTDGSGRAREAAEEAIELAKNVGGEVHFLYVVDSSITSGVPEDWAWEQLEGVLQEEGRKSVGKLEKMSEEAGVETERVVLEGIPHREILSYAKDEAMDLIVIATAGRKGLDKLLMGSTTERVLRSSDVPILVIKRGEKKEAETK